MIALMDTLVLTAKQVSIRVTFDPVNKEEIRSLKICYIITSTITNYKYITTPIVMTVEVLHTALLGKAQ